ncbi:MAG: MFS transporter [Anaerolineaceae bacterium]|nr:MFS transporter [Anaerolineaceae bacterium]
MKLKRAAILSLSILTIMATDTVAPLVAQISATFPNVNSALVKQTITLPSLMIIFFGLIAGQLVRVISKKAVLAIGLSLYTIGGIAAGWSQTFAGHLFLRAVLGAGTGLIMPLVTSLITDFYKDKERADMIGYSSSVSYMGGVITPPLAVWVGAQNWRTAFWIFAIAPLIFLFSMLFIPKPPTSVNSEVSMKRKEPIPVLVIWLSIASIVMSVIFFIIITDISFLTQAKQTLAPYVTTFGLSVSTFGSAISGLAFSRVYYNLRKWIIPTGLLVSAAGFLLITFTQSSAIALLGLLCTGLGLGFLIAFILLLTSNSVGANDSTAALAVVNSSFSIGIFLSPFFYSILPNLFSMQPDILFNFQFAGYFFLAAGITAIPAAHLFIKDKSR